MLPKYLYQRSSQCCPRAYPMLHIGLVNADQSCPLLNNVTQRSSQMFSNRSSQCCRKVWPVLSNVGPMLLKCLLNAAKGLANASRLPNAAQTQPKCTPNDAPRYGHCSPNVWPMLPTPTQRSDQCLENLPKRLRNVAQGLPNVAKYCQRFGQCCSNHDLA